MSRTNTASPITGGIDSSAPGTIIRAALTFESLVTVGVGAYYIFYPRHFLLNTMGASPAQTTTAAMQLAQQFGAAYVLVGSMVGLCVPNTKLGVEVRKSLYGVLLAFELEYLPLLVWQAMGMEGGFGKKELLVTAGQFVPFMVWRVFTLGWRQDWFGRWVEGGKRE